MLFLLFLLDDGRIRKGQKHMNPTDPIRKAQKHMDHTDPDSDPDPQH